MESIHKFEKTMVNWYKSVPHLPRGGRNWLADNIWWMALISVILSVVALVVAIPVFFAALALSTAVTPYVGYDMAYYNATTVGMAWLALGISVVSLIVTAVLLAMAVNPLKVKNKRGWDLVYLSLLATFALNVIGSIVVFSFGGVFSAVIGALVGGYFLFEIRDNFVGVKKEKTVKAKKAAAKA